MNNEPTAQDFLDAVEAQRNDALNLLANAKAELACAKREIEALQKENETLRQRLEKKDK